MSAKTDVIFLGAGASYSAGFPTNIELTRYIIDELPRRNRCVVVPKDSPSSSTVEQEWRQLAQVLRKANCLSIDEFCELAQPSYGDGIALKQMLRLALFDKVKDWKRWNDYVRLLDTLFIPRSFNLDDRFTVVNFNYDGLLGKMLVDAVRQRRQVNNQPPLPRERLAAIAGGWCGSGVDGHPGPATQCGALEVDKFCHHMPHGTFTAAQNAVQEVIATEDLIYGDADHETKEKWFLKHYEFVPMIHFPWERSSRLQIHTNQLIHTTHSVAEAKRIHFIGLSGHSLLRHTMRDIFWSFEPVEQFATKKWHVATADPNHERIFGKLMDCFLPDVFQKDEKVRSQLARNVTYYKSFAAWLDEAPHLTL